MNKRKLQVFSVCMATVLATAPIQYVKAAESNQTIAINEIESDDETGIDWVEIINTGKEPVDIGNWFITDNKELERLEENEEWRIAEGTILKAGEILVVEHSEALNNLSLGKEDSAILYDQNNNKVDEYAYSGHAIGTYSRVPDGTGDFVDQEATKGNVNIVEEKEDGRPEYKLVINEVNSSPDDWIELLNLGTKTMDISGYEIRDNSDDHRWKFADGTVINANEMLVVDAQSKGKVFDDKTNNYVDDTFEAAIGIGSGDAIRIYDNNGVLLDECSWSEHASYNGDAALASIGRYPDGTGSFSLTKETKGKVNEWYKPEISINEVESDCEDVVSDWVEIYNYGTTDVDISGWYLYDNDPVGHATDIKPVKEGTILKSGEFYTFEINTDFSFGLGKDDKAVIYNKDGNVIDEFSWSNHATGVYARIPDGTGEFIDFATSTKGKANIDINPVVINEIASQHENGERDWIELANPTSDNLDISGIIIKDNNDNHQYIIPEKTTISANGFIVIDEDELGFEFDAIDSVRLYEDDMLIGSISWDEHPDPTLGLYPDVNGTEYRNTKEATPGKINKFNGIPEVISWPGKQTVEVYDKTSMFLEDSSGLDFFNGQLYAVDNGTGKFWILNVTKDGDLSYADGFDNGKRIRYQKDANDVTAAGPDTEGICVDGDGMVYVASERDNSLKGVNYNSILMVNPNEEKEDLVALKEWNITDSLPEVSANMGIEAVEWVSSKDVNGKLFDQNTNTAFNISNYPNAIANGVFFVALEDNGHVYAYILNQDGTAIQIADIDAMIGGAMALDYDTYENVLWVVADNGYKNRAAQVVFTGQSDVEITHVLAPTGLDINENYEGFAITDSTYGMDGQRTVYRFLDGVSSGALSIGSLGFDNNNGNSSNGSGENSGQANNENNNSSNEIREDLEQANDKVSTNKNSLVKTGDTVDSLYSLIGVVTSFMIILSIICGRELLARRFKNR